MKVDLSRSMEPSFRNTVKRADKLRASGQNVEAASVYREAARLAEQLVQYAVSPAEKARRNRRARNLEAFAEKVAAEKTAPIADHAGGPAGRSGEQADESGPLQAQIDALITRADVSWEDIGGLVQTKREIQLAFGMAMAKRPRDVRIDVVRNVLLYGPPGTGKSLLAAAVSNGLEATFFNVSASKLLSKWFGESPRLISSLYATARNMAPAVVFIDELEALFPSRESATTGAERRVLSTLLTELSGVADSGESPTVFTIGATNAPWLMDSAGQSRFGRRIYVPLPDPQARHAVLNVHLTRKGHKLDFSIDRLVESTEGLSGRQLAHLAAAAVENMVAQCNPDLADLAASGNAALEEYQIKTRSLKWADLEPILAKTRPDTLPEALRQFETW
ncbi:MAG: 26S protease regulatory subunit [Pirellulales bacterium]